MEKPELVETLRKEAWEINALLKKLQKRADALNALADQIDAIGKPPPSGPPEHMKKIWKIVDSIYGEKPKRKKVG